MKRLLAPLFLLSVLVFCILASVSLSKRLASPVEPVIASQGEIQIDPGLAIPAVVVRQIAGAGDVRVHLVPEGMPTMAGYMQDGARRVFVLPRHAPPALADLPPATLQAYALRRLLRCGEGCEIDLAAEDVDLSLLSEVLAEPGQVADPNMRLFTDFARYALDRQADQAEHMSDNMVKVIAVEGAAQVGVSASDNMADFGAYTVVGIALVCVIYLLVKGTGKRDLPG